MPGTCTAVENPEPVTENKKQTFGDKRNLVDQFPGEENRYEIQVWSLPRNTDQKGKK